MLDLKSHLWHSITLPYSDTSPRWILILVPRVSAFDRLDCTVLSYLIFIVQSLSQPYAPAGTKSDDDDDSRYQFIISNNTAYKFIRLISIFGMQRGDQRMGGQGSRNPGEEEAGEERVGSGIPKVAENGRNRKFFHNTA